MNYDATLVLFIAAFKAAHADDAAAQRAADRALTNLQSAPVLSFDTTELRVLSSSRGKDNVYHVADGIGCTCEGGKHPWCWHRVVYRVMLAQQAAADPGALIRDVLAVAAPADREAAAVEATDRIVTLIGAVAADAGWEEAVFASAGAPVDEREKHGPWPYPRANVTYTPADLDEWCK